MKVFTAEKVVSHCFGGARCVVDFVPGALAKVVVADDVDEVVHWDGLGIRAVEEDSLDH